MNELTARKSFKKNSTPTRSNLIISTPKNNEQRFYNEAPKSIIDKLKKKQQKNPLANLTNLITDNSSITTQNEKEINVTRHYVNANNPSTPNRDNQNIYMKTEGDQNQAGPQNYYYNYNYRFQNYSSSHDKSKMTINNFGSDENKEHRSHLSLTNQINPNNVSSKIGLNLNCGISKKPSYNQEDTYGIKPQCDSGQKLHLQKGSLSHSKTFQNIIPRRPNTNNNMININSLLSPKGPEKDENLGLEVTQNKFYSSNSKSHNNKYENSATPTENNKKANTHHEDTTIEKFYSSGKIQQNFGIKMNPNKLTKEQLTNIQFNNNIKYLEQSLKKNLDFSRESIQPDGLNRTINYIDRTGNHPLHDQQSTDRNIITQSLNMTTTNNKGLLNLSSLNNHVSHPVEGNLTPQNLCVDQDKVMNVVLELKNKCHEKDMEIIELKNYKIKYEMENQNLLIQIKNMILENYKNQETMDELKIQLNGKEKQFITKRVIFQLNFE